MNGRNEEAATPSLWQIALAWSRIGVIGFGGPPAHIALLRRLCVEDRGWLAADDFEQGVAATSLLPGPASTQLAILCAWRLRGAAGAVIGGLCFIVPGLVLILALSALFLGQAPPRWVRGAAAGAGAAVPAVALRAGLDLARPMWLRARGTARVLRTALYAGAGAAAAATIGPWLVLVLLAAGAVELLLAGRARPTPADGPTPALSPLLPLAFAGSGGIGALAWTALKVGALSFGGGFVIVPLMRADAVSVHHWMSGGRFLSAVALGQITPGPVVLTVAAVGYAAGGAGAGLLAAAVAFAPSFVFVLAAGPRLRDLLDRPAARAFLAGAAPAAAGAILGAAVPLAGDIGFWWQGVVAVGAAIGLLALRGPIVEVLLGAAAIGVLGAVTGAPLP